MSIGLGSVAWDATGGCWEQTLPCSDLCVADGGTCEVGMQGAYQVLSICVWCVARTWCC